MHVSFDCCVNLACVSCLLNKITNQYNPCTLVIMTLKMQDKSIIFAIPPISNDLNFSKTNSHIYFDAKVFQTK
jgi:hypothetical protein